jgi:hypothetical protein
MNREPGVQAEDGEVMYEDQAHGAHCHTTWGGVCNWDQTHFSGAGRSRNCEIAPWSKWWCARGGGMWKPDFSPIAKAVAELINSKSRSPFLEELETLKPRLAADWIGAMSEPDLTERLW